MDKEELISFLKKHLKIQINKGNDLSDGKTRIGIELFLDTQDEIIDIDSDSIILD